jgi:ABC-2 type transport system permease protein
MSVTTVLRDDLRDTGRSFVVLGVVGVLALFVALVVGGDASVYDHAYRALFDVSFLLFLALPLILAPLTYLSVAGRRASGTIKHPLGLPNTRAEFLTATYLSRAAIATAGVAVATVVGFVVAQVAYANAPGLVRFAQFGAVSALFALSIAGVFVAISSTTARRSRAMIGVVAAYFVLGPFWIDLLPVVGLGTVVDTVASTLGVTASETSRELLLSLSPATAYLESTKVAYAGVGDRYEALAGFESDNYYDQLWFNSLVMAVWAVGTLAVGYGRFRTAELG